MNLIQLQIIGLILLAGFCYQPSLTARARQQKIQCSGSCKFRCSKPDTIKSGTSCSYRAMKCCQRTDCTQIGGWCQHSYHECNPTETDVKGAFCAAAKHCCLTDPPGPSNQDGFYEVINGKAIYKPGRLVVRVNKKSNSQQRNIRRNRTL